MQISVIDLTNQMSLGETVQHGFCNQNRVQIMLWLCLISCFSLQCNGDYRIKLN